MKVKRTVSQEWGRRVESDTDQRFLADHPYVGEASLASEHAEGWIGKKCRIPAVTSDILIQRVAAAEPRLDDDLLDIGMHLVPSEENGAATPVAASLPAELPATSFSYAPESLLRVDAERIDSVLNLVGELIIGKSVVYQCVN